MLCQLFNSLITPATQSPASFPFFQPRWFSIDFLTLFLIRALTFIPIRLNLCRETVAKTYLNFLYQLATSVEATQLYDQASPAQQKNAAIVNSLFQLHQAVTKVTLSIRQLLIASLCCAYEISSLYFFMHFIHSYIQVIYMIFTCYD